MNLSIPKDDLETYTGFIDESRDHLDSIEQKVLELAENVDPDSVNTLFRALHTIKGIAGFLGLTEIQHLSHRLESVFDAIRQGSLQVSSDLIRIALANLDHLVLMIGNLESGLGSRTQSSDGNWSVSMDDVEYLADCEKLGAILSPPAANVMAAVDAAFAGTSSGTNAGGSPASVAEGMEEELITPEMKSAFVKESEEILDITEQEFLKLENSPSDSDSIALAFRNIHSFKGNCGFFGFAELERLSHRLENVLDDARAPGASLSKPVLELALQCLDTLHSAINRIGSGGDSRIPDLEIWLGRIDYLAVDPGKTVPPTARLGEILVHEGQASADAVEYALTLQKRPLGEILIDEGLVSNSEVQHALDVQAQKPGQPAVPKPVSKDVKRDIRVDLAKLDQLMDLVGELVISTGMVFNHPVIQNCDSTDLEKISHQLKGVVSDLQNVALGVRMVPIEGTFRKMTRLVHDLSSKIGKKVRLDFLGENTEVDKTVVDQIADPLVHMIRNSVDHGLENPEERKSAGKDPMGVVTLEAGQEGSDILIVIRDDGRGMNREKILQKAVERGLAKENDPDLTDSTIFQFIFQPGFSTAEAITATSGRGVGMDVVKSNIDKLGGRITIASSVGKGSTITLRIPLTLSIIDGMMVQVGSALFILPLTTVRESISPRKENIFHLAGGQQMLKLRGKTFPILHLANLYGIPGTHVETHKGLLIHVEARDCNFCLAVDNLLGQRQVVVKALPGFMANIPGTSSCCILDNGEIALILDVPGLMLVTEKQGRVPEYDTTNNRTPEWLPV